MRTGPDFYCQAYIASGSVAYIYIFIKSHIFSFPARFTSPMHAGYVYRVMLRSHCARDRVATVDRRSQCKRSIRFRWACVIKLRSHRTKLSEPSWQHCYEHVYFSDSFHVPLKHCSQLRLRLSTILLIKILKPLSSSTSDKTWKYSVITLRPSSTSNDIISFSDCDATAMWLRPEMNMFIFLRGCTRLQPITMQESIWAWSTSCGIIISTCFG